MKRNPQLRSERGFTLLELLMVVIIIAILASIALPQYFRVTERARTGQVVQLLASVRGSQLRFKAQDPGDLYDASAGMTGIDLPLPVPMPAGWAPLTVSGPNPGDNLMSARVGGTHNGATLEIDLDSGAVCASDALAAGDWNVGLPGC